MTHITILCVTIFLHRTQAHRGLILSPILSHFMRFWLWLTTGMVTKEWVAVHRKHHRYTEVMGDPHSPHVYGIWNVLFFGALLYDNASKDSQMIETYGVGTPDDWIERHISGLENIVFLHELDHLSGKCFVDRVSDLKLRRAIEQANKHGHDYTYAKVRGL